MPNYQLLKYLRHFLCLTKLVNYTAPGRRLSASSVLNKVWIIGLLTLINITHIYAQGKNFLLSPKTPSWIVDVKPKEARPSAKDISEGYFLSLFENQNHVELQEDYTHIVREIVSDAGVQNGSQISVTYDPAFQKLTFHKVIVWRDGKATNRLKANSFKLLQTEKQLSRFIYSGTYDAFMLLEDIRKGDRIEFAYTTKGFNPIYGKKYASTYYLEGGSSVGHIYTNVVFDKARTLNYKNFNFSDSPKTTEKDGFKMYEWEYTLTKTHRSADFEPSWYNPFRRIQLSEYNSWSDVVEWGLAVNDYPNLKTPLVDKKVVELKAKSGTDLKKYIELATRFVQDEIRYMGIEIGAYSHRPNSPEKIMVQRYGDCKDKSLLLVSLLKAQGINAYMTYADTYTTIKTDQSLPSPFVFNHVIVMVDYANRKTWIDPTISYQRGSFDHFYAPDYGAVLVIKKGVNTLEKIESKRSGKLVSHLTFNVADTSGNKKSTLLIKSRYTDNYADDLRSSIAESGTDGLEKDYLEYYSGYYTDIESKAPIKIVDDEKRNVIEMTERYEIDEIWTLDSTKLAHYVYFYGDLIQNQLRSINAKKRIEPLSMKHPVNVEQEITVNLPYAYDGDAEVIKIERSDYYFELDRRNSGKTASFKYTFRSLSSAIDGSEIKKYIKDYTRIDENLSYYFSAKSDTGARPLGITDFAIIGLLTIVIVSAALFSQLYQKISGFDIDKIEAARPIGGSLIILAIFIIIIPVAFFYRIINVGYLENTFWVNLDKLEGLKAISVKIVCLLNLAAYAVLFSFSGLCLVLFFNRRNNFPKLYVIFVYGKMGLTITNLFLLISGGIGYNVGYNNTYLIVSSCGSIIISVICILYLKKSTRVKETFVFTYPESEWIKALIIRSNRKIVAQEQSEATIQPKEEHTAVNTAENNSTNENI